MNYRNYVPKNINLINRLLNIRRLMSDDKKPTETIKDLEDMIKVNF